MLGLFDEGHPYLQLNGIFQMYPPYGVLAKRFPVNFQACFLSKNSAIAEINLQLPYIKLTYCKSTRSLSIVLFHVGIPFKKVGLVLALHLSDLMGQVLKIVANGIALAPLVVDIEQ